MGQRRWVAGKYVSPRERVRGGSRGEVEIPIRFILGLPGIVLLVIAVIGLRLLGLKFW